MRVQLGTLKAIIQVPRLRAEVQNHDFKDLNFKKFLTLTETLLCDVRGQMAKEGLIKAPRDANPTFADDDDTTMEEDIRKRQSLLNMNQTFGFTNNSITRTPLTRGADSMISQMNKTGHSMFSDAGGDDESKDKVSNMMFKHT